jgi:hypothetical protein
VYFKFFVHGQYVQWSQGACYWVLCSQVTHAHSWKNLHKSGQAWACTCRATPLQRGNVVVCVGSDATRRGGSLAKGVSLNPQGLVAVLAAEITMHLLQTESMAMHAVIVTGEYIL